MAKHSWIQYPDYITIFWSDLEKTSRSCSWPCVGPLVKQVGLEKRRLSNYSESMMSDSSNKKETGKLFRWK